MTESRETKRCPKCAEDVWADAQICRYCRYEFPPPATARSAGEPSGNVAAAPADAGPVIFASGEATPAGAAEPATITAAALGSEEEQSAQTDAEENLSAAIRRAMADGWARGFADDRSAVLYRGTKISHGLHGILSWPLAFWFWYWVYITLRHGGVHQMHITAQRDGTVNVQEAPEATPRWVYIEWVALAIFQIWFALGVYLPAIATTSNPNPYAGQGVYLPGTVTPAPIAATDAPDAPNVNPNGTLTAEQSATIRGVKASVAVQGRNNCSGYELSYSFVLHLANNSSEAATLHYAFASAIYGGVASSSDCYAGDTTGETVEVPAGQAIDIGFRDTMDAPTDLTVSVDGGGAAHWVLAH